MKGSIPSFLDAILNIAEADSTSTLGSQDSWLSQLKYERDFRINMFGDDTWIKLFPDVFAETDGTTSFYVTDTVEVDRNVTRHVDQEIKSGNWDAIIMHYLGLDHIGHLAGPKSALMPFKQAEIDQVVRDVYNIVSKQDEERKKQISSSKPTLIVLCGDHGMTEGGNHGGSSFGETSTALVLLSPSIQTTPSIVNTVPNNYLYHAIVDQIDIVPTVSALFGVPIPKNSLGVIIKQAFTDEDAWSRALRLNAHQIHGLVSHVHGNHDGSAFEQQCDALDEGSRLHCLYRTAQNTLSSFQGLVLEHFISEAKSNLSKMFTSYDLDAMFYGIGLLAISTAVFIALVFSRSASRQGFSSIGIVALAYCLLMFASSYVEEEHQFWYFVIQSVWSADLLRAISLRDKNPSAMQVLAPLLQLVSARILRRWNQTGQKFLGEWDFREYLAEDRLLASLLLFSSIAVYVMLSAVVLRTKTKELDRKTSLFDDILKTSVNPILTFGLGMLVFNFKVRKEGHAVPEWMQSVAGSGDPIGMAKAIYWVAAVQAMLTVILNWKSNARMILEILPTLSLVLMSLSRTHDAFVFALFGLQLVLLYTRTGQRSYTIETSIYLLSLQMASFWILGKSNSLASVDLSNAYNGVSTYDTPFVGLLTFASNWAGPIWWSFGSLIVLMNCGGSEKFERHAIATSAFQGLALTTLSVAVTLLRTHLFIWTVFSPAYLFRAAHTVILNGGCNVLLAGVFWFAAKTP